MDEHQKQLLKNLPKIDEMMLRSEKRENLAGFPREIVKEACRKVVEGLRARILREKGETLRLPTPEQAADLAAGIIIAKLQEYRTALISAAVTGKTDVREAA